MTRTDPALIQRILSDNAHQPLITPTQWIVHTAVDGPGPTNLGNYFESATSLESHTWLRWDRHEQFIWFDRSADANYHANHWWNPSTKRYEGAISTETEDDGQPVMKPWNAYQLKELIRFGVWLNKTFHIPARLCRSPHDPGMGWHSMWGAPSEWTNVAGKSCPGSTRIKQFKEVVLPGIQKALAAPAPSKQEDSQVIWHIENSPYTFLQCDAGMKPLNEAEFWELAGAGMQVKSVPNDKFVTINKRLHALANRPLQPV